MYIERAILLLAIAGAQACLSGSADAQDAVLRLEPSTPWNLDYAEDSCALRRGFTDGTHSAFLEMRQFAPDAVFRFMIYSDDMDVGEEGADYVVNPDSQSRQGREAFPIYIGETGKGMVFSGGIGELDETGEERSDLSVEERATRESAIAGVTLLQAFEQPIRLETGPLNAPMEGMRACLDELLTHWGIDVQAHRTLTREVQPRRVDRLLREMWHSYPARALGGGYQAALRLRLIVNTDGRVDECNVQAAVGLDDFHESACRTLRNYARFEPALDANGIPIRSYWTTSVSYRIQ